FEAAHRRGHRDAHAWVIAVIGGVEARTARGTRAADFAAHPTRIGPSPEALVHIEGKALTGLARVPGAVGVGAGREVDADLCKLAFDPRHRTMHHRVPAAAAAGDRAIAHDAEGAPASVLGADERGASRVTRARIDAIAAQERLVVSDL